MSEFLTIGFTALVMSGPFVVATAAFLMKKPQVGLIAGAMGLLMMNIGTDIAKNNYNEKFDTPAYVQKRKY